MLRSDAVLALADDTAHAVLPAAARRVGRIMDGVRSVERIRKRCGLTPVELQAALTALQERGLVRLVGFVDTAAQLEETTGGSPRPKPVNGMIDDEDVDAPHDPLNPEFQNYGVPFSVLAAAARGLEPHTIVARFGRMFFIASEHGEHGSREETVFFARRRPGSDQLVVTIGRGGANDICIAHDSVSRFHAYLKEANGAFLLQDAKSEHGTTVDEQPVLARDSGPPTELRDGQRVRFGAVSTVFVDVSGLLFRFRKDSGGRER